MLIYKNIVHGPKNYFFNTLLIIIFNKTNYVKKLIVLLFFVHGLGVKAQTFIQPIAAKYEMVGAYSQKFTDVYSTQNNAASLTNLKQGGISVFGENRFGISNLNLYSLSLALPTSNGSFGIHASMFGLQKAKQFNAKLGYGIAINKKISVGTYIDYNQIQQPNGYGNLTAITGSVSVLIAFTEKVTGGLNIYNPIRAKLGNNGEDRLPSMYSFGLGYDASDKFFISGEIVKEEGMAVNANIAAQCNFVKDFFIRGGVQTETGSLFGAVSFTKNKFRIDIAASNHPQLGITPGLLIMYNFSEKLKALAGTPKF